MKSCKTCRSLFPRKKRSRSCQGRQICKRCCRRRATDPQDDANQKMQQDYNNSFQQLVSSSIYLVQDNKTLCWKNIRGMDVYFGVFMWAEDQVLDSSWMVSNDNYSPIQSQQPNTNTNTELTQIDSGSKKVTKAEVQQNINNIDGCSNKQCTRKQVVCILEYIRHHAGNVEFHSKSLISLVKMQQRYEDEGICRDGDISEVINLITDELRLQWNNKRLKIQDIIKIYENLLQAKKFASKNKICTYYLALENLIKQVIEAKSSFERRMDLDKASGSLRGTTVQWNTNTQASYVYQPMKKSFTQADSFIKGSHKHNYNNHNQLHNYLYRNCNNNSYLPQSTQNSKIGGQLGFNSVCAQAQYEILNNGVGKRKFSGTVTNYLENNNNNNNWRQNLVSEGKRIVIDLTIDDDNDSSLGVVSNLDGQAKKQGTVVKQEVLQFDPLQMTRRGG